MKESHMGSPLSSPKMKESHMGSPLSSPEMKESHMAKECCMCGDTGFSDEIFQCRTCLHRFQHKYCSCLYPKTEADSYQTCDWCLTSGELNRKAASKQIKDCSERSCPDHDHYAIKKQKYTGGVERLSATGDITADVQSQKLIGNERIHKQGGGGQCVRRGVGMSCKEDSGRTQQVQIPSSKASATARLVRGKVRRYKLLEEVSS